VNGRRALCQARETRQHQGESFLKVAEISKKEAQVSWAEFVTLPYYKIFNT